jgi:hypothetical protein
VDELVDLLDLALAHERGCVRRRARLHHPSNGLGAGGAGQRGELVQRVLVTASDDAGDDGAFGDGGPPPGGEG